MEKEKEFMDEWDKVLVGMPTLFRCIHLYGLMEAVRSLAYGFFLCGKRTSMQEFVDKYNKKQ